MSKLIDLTGQRFGRLTVIARAPNTGKRVKWVCLCDCKKEKIVDGGHLRSGAIQSCGCLHREVTSIKHSTHRKSESILYHIWCGIKARCHNPQNKSYMRYGGRGIAICLEWETSFEVFYNWAIRNGYKPGLTIDRIDNDKGYYPDNCRWTTEVIQARNRRSNRLLQFQGDIRPIAEWAEIRGIPYGTLLDRLRHGWSVERALVEPIHTEKIHKRK